MNKICIVSLITAFFSATFLNAQNIKYSDMLMSSQNYSWGTARSLGMGGSFGSLGGDMSSLSLNPAGIGVYRSSEFSFTPSYNFYNSSSKFYGKTNESFSDKLNLGNIGIVFNSNTSGDIGWVGASFGIAYNRLNDFNRDVYMKTESATSSFLDEFAYYGNGGDGIDPDNLAGPLNPSSLYQYYEGLGYETYALDTVLYGNGWYHSDYSKGHLYGELQERLIKTRGGIGEYALSFGANYSHKFYFGFSLGIQRLDFNSETRHTEEDNKNQIQNLDYFDFYEYSDIKGTGYNFKAGFIYKPIEFVRLGLAIHTPTVYNLESSFSTYMYSGYDSNIIPADGGGYTNYSYRHSDTRFDKNRLQTPLKFIGSLGLQLQKFGVINVDYERLNYSKMKLSGDNINSQNDDVRANYTSVNNIRIGAEGKIEDIALRIGYGYNGTPYKDSNLSNIYYETYSGGIGYRGENFSIDFAYSLLSYSDTYKLYDFVERERPVGTETEVYNLYEPVIADIDYKINRFVLTLGFKF